MKKVTTPATVMAVMAYIANDNSINATAKKFKISASSVSGMCMGKTHTETTGLSKDGNKGVDYIRANKELFVKVPTNEKVPAPVETPSITETTVKAETKTAPVAVGSTLDFSDSRKNIQAEAETALTRILTRTKELTAEMSALGDEHKYWAELATQFATK